MSVEVQPVVPRAFVWRRLHSLLGLGLVVYLVEHLLVNSQAALWIGNDGSGFVKLVNLIQGIPYLQVVEVLLIGLPILVHTVVGIKYLLTSKGNVYSKTGEKPSLSYGRNLAYSWQRITSWILLVGIIGHVVQMRYLDKPVKATIQNRDKFLVKLNFDAGLYTLSSRLYVDLYNRNEVQELISSSYQGSVDQDRWTSPKSIEFRISEQKRRVEKEILQEQKQWGEALESFRLNPNQVIAVANDFGTATLLAVRNTFKSPFMAILYTVFVLAAVFHAFNGFWTFLITWGAILSYRSQKVGVNITILIMLAIGFLGLAAIWGSYWINLRS